MKKTDLFDKLDNTFGNFHEGKATQRDVIKVAYQVNEYLLKNPHPHDFLNEEERARHNDVQEQDIMMYIKHYRNEIGLTIEELADKIGVCSRTVTRWEKGEKTPNNRRMQDIAKALNIETDSLLIDPKVAMKKRFDDLMKGFKIRHVSYRP